jgi:hypothetical protein
MAVRGAAGRSIIQPQPRSIRVMRLEDEPGSKSARQGLFEEELADRSTIKMNKAANGGGLAI